MSANDREGYSGTRPFECIRCGAGMRTRGIDGRCFNCFAFPVVRCERCARVRFDPDSMWEDHPGLVPGEVMGTCKTCGDLAKQEQERQYARDCRRTAARAAKGYGPAPEGVDIWKGFEKGE